MKCIIVAAVLAVVSLSVNGHFGGGDSRGGDFFGSDSLDSSSADDYQYGNCQCQTSSRTGISKQCQRIVTGIVGCPNTKSYIQCTAPSTCAVVACPTGQVWNKAKSACAACDTGMHLRADLQTCVCDKGNTRNSTTGLCVKCPTGATEEVDRCFCPLTTILHKSANACEACPTGTTIDRDGDSCRCPAPTNTTTPRLYWNAVSWKCEPCPGVATKRTVSKRFTEDVCTCPGAADVFDVKSVSCLTCPSDITIADKIRNQCRCKVAGLKFDTLTKTCACRKGYTLNSAGTGCQVMITTTEAPTAAPRNP